MILEARTVSEPVFFGLFVLGASSTAGFGHIHDDERQGKRCGSSTRRVGEVCKRSGHPEAGRLLRDD